jgi:hypothetical protein
MSVRFVIPELILNGRRLEGQEKKEEVMWGVLVKHADTFGFCPKHNKNSGHHTKKKSSPYVSARNSRATHSIYIYISIYLWFYSPCGTCPPFQFRNLYTFDRTPWTGDQPVARPSPTHKKIQKQNQHTQTSMTTIPVFDRAKTVHVLDHAATVMGRSIFIQSKKVSERKFGRKMKYMFSFG